MSLGGQCHTRRPQKRRDPLAGTVLPDHRCRGPWSQDSYRPGGVRAGDTWTPRGQRSCPEKVGTGELGKAIYISLDGVMAERPPGAPGPRSSQPGSPRGQDQRWWDARSRQRRLGSLEDTMRAMCLMVTGLGASCCLQPPPLKATTCSGGPRLLEALLLELVNLPINAGPMCAFMRRGGPDKALPQAPGRQLCPRSWSVSPLQPRP